MAASIAAPQQHKQPSRKGKKAWRKNVDISEVQAGLETVREEVIKGGIISELPSTSLFTLDTTGSESIQRAYRKTHKPLKADEILAARSAVPALDSHKRPASRLTDGLVPPSVKKRRTAAVSPRELERLKHVAYGGAAAGKDIIQPATSAMHDPWAAEQDDPATAPDPNFSFLPRAKPIREPPTLKHAPVSLAASGRPLPALPKPARGKSYNPLATDWAALLERAGAREVAAEEARLAAAQAERERLARAQAAAAEPDPADDDGAGASSAWESEWEGFQSEAEAENATQALSQKRPRRKTPAERNRILRRKEAERRAVREAKQRAKERQVAQVGELVEAVERRAARRRGGGGAVDVATAEEQGSENEVDEEEVELRRRGLGKYGVPEAPLEVVLPEELTESLRSLKPEGNLLKDRYRSMLLRGKVEARRPVQHKQAKRTYTEKWTYKDWKLK